MQKRRCATVESRRSRASRRARTPLVGGSGTCSSFGVENSARYDGNAEWYDETMRAYGHGHYPASLMAELLGHPPSPAAVCLDVGCGTGLHAASIASAGYTPIGLDLSGDQLAIARTRTPALLRGDAARLPFASGCIPRVVSAFTHTDMDDFASVVAEVARVLCDGGRFVYVGLHPCFVGSFLDRSEEVELRILRLFPGYGEREVRLDATGRFSLRSRVGGSNLALADFLRAFLDAPGLSLRSFRELDTRSNRWDGHSDGRMVPWNIAVVADKSRAS
jgi:SAM-dependent methyltransferase